MRSDDLAPLIAPNPPDGSTVRWGQGVVVSWDPATAENVIRYRGTDLVNLPIVASSGEVLATKPGDVVGLNIIGSGGAATVYIVGRITQPGTPQAASFMELFGLATDLVFPIQSVSGSSYQDLATVGPSIPVTIGKTGRVIVLLSAYIVADESAVTSFMSFEIRDSNNVQVLAPDDGTALKLENSGALVGKIVAGQLTFAVLHAGLAPGDYVFTAKYRRLGTSGLGQFGNRSIIAIPY